jgi:hypothetical protein
LEWDDRIPAFEEVHDEAMKAKRYLEAVTGAEDRQWAGVPV